MPIRQYDQFFIKTKIQSSNNVKMRKLTFTNVYRQIDYIDF